VLLYLKSSSRLLVIFDCDGVLVDSEPLSNGTFVKMLGEAGFPISYEEGVERFVGKSISTCIHEVELDMGRKLPASFLSTFREITFELFKKELQQVTGIREVLTNLPYESCVASSGPHEKIKLTLGITDLYPFFEGKIFSASDVERGKPFPDLFLHAASSMGYDPESCIVVEDAVPGVHAARSAGMRVLGYAERASATRLSEAGALTFTRMDELIELLSKI
jgi:HAD superfamily hydrolase (TIGR01509 family)